MEKSTVLRNSNRGIKPQIPTLPETMPIPYVLSTIQDPSTLTFDSLDDIVDYCEAVVSSIKKADADFEPEWDFDGGYQMVSKSPDIIADFAELWADEPVSEDEELMELFEAAVITEFARRPKVYSSLSVDDMVSYWISHYKVSASGHFARIYESVKPRVSLVEEDTDD